MTHLWTEQVWSHQSCAAWSTSLAASSTTDTVHALFASLQGFTWSCTTVSSRLLPTCVIYQCQKQTAIVHTRWPRRHLNCDGFWTTLFCHVCTTGMEPAATRDQQQSVAEIFQVSTQDLSVQKVWTLATAPLTWVRLVTSSALQSRKWQLIGMSSTALTSTIISITPGWHWYACLRISHPCNGFGNMLRRVRNCWIYCYYYYQMRVLLRLLLVTA